MTNLLQPAGDSTETADGLEDDPSMTLETKQDGRSLRRQRNRDAVIRALIDLIREGDLSPTVGRIADRAELSHRSVFRYFDDLDDLARTAIDTAFREAWPLSRVADVGQGTLDDRIGRIVDAQLRTLQLTYRLGLVARSRAHETVEVERGMKRVFDLHLDQVRAQFATELDAMEPDHAAAIAASIAVTVWLDSYDLLHRTAGYPIERIAEIWRSALHALLT